MAASNSIDATSSGIQTFNGSAFTSLGQSTHPAPLGSDGSSNIYFEPLKVIWLYDDFTSGNTAQALNWSTVQGGSATYATESSQSSNANPGVVSFTTSGSFGSTALRLGKQLAVGGGRIVLTFVAKLAQLGNATNRPSLQIGLMDGYTGVANGDPANNGIFFQYQDNLNSGSWQMICKSATVTTTNNSSTAADTNWHNYIIDINAAGSSVSFFIDGVIVANGTITTNIPSVLLAPAYVWALGASNGSNIIAYWDAFSLYCKLTNTR